MCKNLENVLRARVKIELRIHIHVVYTYGLTDAAHYQNECDFQQACGRILSEIARKQGAMHVSKTSPACVDRPRTTYPRRWTYNTPIRGLFRRFKFSSLRTPCLQTETDAITLSTACRGIYQIDRSGLARC